MSSYKYKRNVPFIRIFVSIGEVKGWVQASGGMGALVYFLLKHRYTLDRSKTKSFVTLPLDLRERFGMGTKVIKRLRTQLQRAGLIEIKRNAGRPWQYRIIDKGKPEGEERSLLEE